jgi:hypothetical protein
MGGLAPVICGIQEMLHNISAEVFCSAATLKSDEVEGLYYDVHEEVDGISSLRIVSIGLLLAVLSRNVLLAESQFNG